MQAGVSESTDTLLESGQDTRKLTNIKYGVCVWACGNGPRPICRQLIETHQTSAPGRSYAGERIGGRILIDPWLRMIGLGDGSVFALGDCAESEEGPLPQTAQVAAQQGAYLAHLLNDEVGRAVSPREQAGQYGGRVEAAIEAGVRAGDPVAAALKAKRGTDVKLARPFEFLSLGILAYVGNQKALAQVNLQETRSWLSLARARPLALPLSDIAFSIRALLLARSFLAARFTLSLRPRCNMNTFFSAVLPHAAAIALTRSCLCWCRSR